MDFKRAETVFTKRIVVKKPVHVFGQLQSKKSNELEVPEYKVETVPPSLSLPKSTGKLQSKPVIIRQPSKESITAPSKTELETKGHMVAHHFLRLVGKEPVKRQSLTLVLKDNMSDRESVRDSVRSKKFGFFDKFKTVVSRIRKQSVNSAMMDTPASSTAAGSGLLSKSPFSQFRNLAGAVIKQKRDNSRIPLSLTQKNRLSSVVPASLFQKATQSTQKPNTRGAAFKFSIDPEGDFKMFWESMKFLLLIWTFFYLPIKVVFIPDNESVMLYAIDKMIDLIFLIDIFLNFITPIYLNYELVYSRKMIAKAYLAGWFVLDLIAVLPIEEVYDWVVDPEDSQDNIAFLAKASKFVRLLRLLKLIRLFKTFDFTNTDNYFIKVISAKFKGTIFYLLLPNFILMVFTMHILTCIWFFVANISDGIEDWIWENQLQDRDVFYLYVASFYLVVQSYTSCGYGDIKAQRPWEMGFKICTIVIGSVMYGIYTGRIIDYRSCRAVLQDLYEQRSSKFEQIAKEYSLDKGISLWVRDALKLAMDQPLKTDKKRLDLSAISKEDLQELRYRKVLAKFAGHPLFSKKMAHREWVLQVEESLQKALYNEGDIIYKTGEVPTHMYIIKSGTVVVSMSNIETLPVYMFKKGFFGEHEILNSGMREHTVFAASDCEIYKIGVQDFRKLFVAVDYLHQDMINFSNHRKKEIEEAQTEFKFILRRKMFWRLALPPTKSRKTKKMKNIIDMACSGNQVELFRKGSTLG